MQIIYIYTIYISQLYIYIIYIELNNLLTGRQDYIQKKSENEMVLKEFMLLSEGASIYKMIGPVLAKQEIVEAKGNVQKRLDYINAEVYITIIYANPHIGAGLTR